ncbi:MAG: DNA polymerase III subunit [Eubacteriales bacterium]|nr:DNA polymerase III subunit [Eubacteriales bacterium]
MSFSALLGNDQLKRNLEASLGKNHISHFYLISGPVGSGKHTLARLLGAAILCQGRGKPCLGCGPCRKVMDGSHPDFITVDDPEKKTVTVDLIRDARADIYIQPNESDHKIYLFPRAQDMGLPGQNALLKVLEEPPKYGVFLLLTDNPDKLLPTVRSRCTELKLLPLSEDVLSRQLRADFPQAAEADISAAVERSGGFLGQARQLLEGGGAVPPQTEAFVRAFAARDALALVQTLVPMEKWKRDALQEILAAWLELTESALVSRSGLHAASPLARELSRMRSGPELHAAAQALRKARDYTAANVSPAAVCGYLAWALR